MITELYKLICNMDSLVADGKAKADLSNVILAYLKLDTNNPDLFVKKECSDNCHLNALKLSEFLEKVYTHNH
jgi:hypothetical protein